MSGKNLTFKLILDADNKGLVSTAKNSETVMKAVFDSIKSESDKLKQAAESASKEIGNIIPKNASERATALIKSLNETTEIIKGTGAGVANASESFSRFGVDSVRSLNLLKANLSTAKTKLEEFSKTNATPEDILNAQQQIDSLEKEVQQADRAFNAFKSELSLISPEIKKVNGDLNSTEKELNGIEGLGRKASDEIGSLKNSFSILTGVLASLGIGVTARELLETADAVKSLEARIGLAVGTSGNLEQALKGVQQIAIETRSNLVATGELFSRVNTAVKDLGYTQEKALSITRLINQAMVVGGGSAASNEAAITQLNQAFQSGVLRGEEFNSMMEQSPRLSKALADGLGVTIGKLRDMANQGQLTTDVVIKALQSQAEVVENEFAKMPITVGQSIENLKTAWMLYIGEADAASGASAKVAEAIKLVSENLDVLVTTFTAAAQAFIAYKALGMAAVFLEKANAARGAQVAIAAETIALNANVAANVANARATQLTAVAKTQLTAATNASTIANTAAAGNFGKVTAAAGGLKAGLVSVLSRFGAYGIAAAGIVLASDLIIDGLKKTDEWLLRQGSNFIDWSVSKITGTKSLVDQEKEWIAAEEASRKKQEEAAAAKEKNAARTEMLKNASLGLNEVSKATVAEFDKQVKAGEKVSEALEGVAKSFNFDSTTGINNGITALLALQTQGKASGEEIRKALTGILKDEDLVAFQGRLAAIPINIEKQIEATNVKIKAKQTELDAWKKANQDASWNDWKAATDKYRADIEKLQAEASALHVQYANSVKGAAMVQGAVLDAAIAKTGLSYEQLSGKSSEAFTTAMNGVKTLEKGLGELEDRGVNTGAALTASMSKAIDTANSRVELDAAKAKLIELEKQGLITGEQVALGLGLIEKKAQQLPDALNPAIAAFNALGIKTKEQLNEAAESAKRNFDVVSKSGQATADGIKQAYTTMLNAAIASGDKARIAAVQAKAASHGLTVEISETGKAVVQTTSEWVKANVGVENSARGIGDGYRHAGNIAREEAKSSTEAWNEAVKASSDKFKAEMKRQGESLSKGIYDYSSYSKADVLSQLKSKGYSDKEAEKLAGSIWSEAMAADRSAKEQGLGKDGSLAVKALINAEFNNAASKGLTTQHGTNKINELLNQMTASSLVSTGPSAKPVDVNSLAPNVSTPVPSTTSNDVSRTVKYEFNSGGKAVTLYGSPNDGDAMEALLSEFEMLKKSS